MSMPRIGVWLDSYGRAVRAALRAAADDGFAGVQAGALAGELSPSALSRTGRRHLMRHLADLGLRLDGLGLEFPGLGLAEPAWAEHRLALTRAAVTLAHELGAERVAVRVGGLKSDASEPATDEALSALAELSDRSGVLIAVQPADGDIRQAALRVRDVDCQTLRVAVDTLDTPDASDLCDANLAGRVGCATLRDVRRRGTAIEQTAYGAGDVDFRAVLAALEQSGYDGPLVLRSEAGDRETLRRGRIFLESAASLNT